MKIKPLIALMLCLPLTANAYTATGSQRTVQHIFRSNEEPTAKDALWTASNIFKVGVIDDGTRRNGYADYVCIVLAEKGIASGVWVQIIDIVKLKRDNDWTAIGEARCK